MARFTMIISITILLLIQFLTDLSAQQKWNTWFRATASYNISNKWQSDLEFQHRRQSTSGSDNPLYSKQLLSIRPWIYYHWKSFLDINLSPFAYYRSFPAINKEAAFAKLPITEYRTSAGFLFKIPIINRLRLTHRSLFEYRIFDESRNTIRAREGIGLKYLYNDKLRFFLQQEYLWNIHGVNRAYFFDQARSSFSVQKGFGQHVAIELGYLFVRKLPLQQAAAHHEHNLVFNTVLHFN
ncbi:hypothetical protein COR50_00210 [Chitinophaga caeni]|uniref:DUF2490 domain-containing protein n=1 Tax=Chitinophaga caeni TaxID=2029983 RepID=A0A291QP59_9BACT|nr:DUF2490 domain-containing protein [Chitinophaga caeni]ATL45707.1 hypothetical protein COR50_00210 [Chitinophaga caeni]